MVKKENVLMGLQVKFPEVEERHLDWAATELFAAYKLDEDRTNEIFFQKVEDGLREGNESAIQVALASVRALAV